MTSRNLSDWDVLAVDETGRPTTGLFKTRSGFKAYVKANELWIEDPDGTVSQVDPGYYYGQELDAVVYEMPRNGIGFICMTDDRWAMIGVSVYGWIGDQYVGVDEDDMVLFRQLMQQDVMIKTDEQLQSITQVSFEYALRYNQGDAHIAFEHGLKVPCSKPGQAATPILRKALTCAMNERVA